MDHHCFWINNCIGYRNQKSFILFLVYTAVLGSASLLVSGYGLAQWSYEFATAEREGVVGVYHGLLVLVCVLALKFTSEFLSEQLDFLETNATLVETYQNSRGADDENMFIKVFGTHCLGWFIPMNFAPYVDFTEPVFLARNLRKQDADELGIEFVGDVIPSDQTSTNGRFKVD